ncbi:FCD domain-containing protein [Nitratireductor mangrovi]|uniref:Pyruvate dehydrogenase complex repressor n=1 Tax=Nitratireductor mangrovi TaxID=2599600 RepID=A0A5B8L2V6_9HYPH|nr:FCD domain-containing protein [Nitratireductor mangrovi]QDZ02327.1 FCD domain-containing protein [Nitratireductor mangrovi]
MSELFSRIDHARTADEVVRRIEDLILEGILRSGDRLPGERELASMFDVSRPILRDALKQLEARGLLVSRHGGGTRVADIIGEVFTQPVMELISGHGKATADYLEFRREIEGVAARLAAERATPDDRVLLSGILDRMRAAHERADFDEEARLDVEFHGAIGECAHNIILLHTLRSCYRLLADGVFFNRTLIYRLAGARDALLEQHLAIGDAVLAGKPASALEAARRHIDFVESAIAKAERADNWQKVSRLRLAQRSRDHRNV